MLDFFRLLSDFFHDIFTLLMGTVIRYGDGFNDITTLGAILVAGVVIGFVVNVYWKGAKA